MEQPTSKRSWSALDAQQRRIIGVLIEKAKTTPDAYPLTLNALTNGCNQKSNRHPQMSLAADDVEVLLDELRQIGAITEVLGGGRVSKYRHNMYDWLGVEKSEIAVMAELLLRGEQTVGELRGRAARMEPIADLATLKPLLASLCGKGLVILLTPEGRGQIVTHALYEERELDEIRSRIGRQGSSDTTTEAAVVPTPPLQAASSSVAPTAEQFAKLRDEIAQLRAEVDQLRSKLG